jgi:uncharacterized protein (TIGR02444 family)
VSAAPGFWPFSKAVYAQEGVKEACLELQSAGLDVNVGLFVVWAVATGRDPHPVMGEVLNRSALWRSSVVQPLREARDRLKPAPDFIDADAAASLRKAILKSELDAERLQQAALEPLAALCPTRGGAGRRAAAMECLSAAAERTSAGPQAVPAITRFVEIVFSSLENV